MKWPTSKSSSSFARLFPLSWFFKSNQKGGKHFEFAAVKTKEARFYSMDEDDFFWRLSFGDERIPARKSTGGINDSTSIRSSQECRNFNEMVSDIRRMRESRGKQRKTGDSSRKRNQTSRKSRGFHDEQEKISNLKDLNHPTSRELRGFDDGEEKISNLQDLNRRTSRKLRGFDDEEEKISNLQDLNHRTSRNLRGFNDEEEKTSTLQERFSNSVSEWLEIEGRKLKEIKIKSDSKTNKNPAKMVIKSNSPRTECKIRALEEMKKSRSRKKKKEQMLEEDTIFDSVAVVKSSYNPQKDFRESMVEMIRERGIESAEDLEQLLACYLTLNHDDYHDLIIKVFRQVWFEMKDSSVKSGSYYDHGID